MPVTLHCPEGCKIEINGESRIPDVWCEVHDSRMRPTGIEIPVNDEGTEDKGFE